MYNHKALETPLKKPEHILVCPPTASSNNNHDSLTYYVAKVDFKEKTHQLIKEIAEVETKYKKSCSETHRQKEIVSRYEKQCEKLFSKLKVSSFEQADLAIQNVMNHAHHLHQNSDRAVEWTNIIEQYKKIINAQQKKHIKLQQTFKICQMKYFDNYIETKKQLENIIENQSSNSVLLKEVEEKHRLAIQQVEKIQLQIQGIRLEKENLVCQVQSFSSELKILKQEYKKVILERDRVKSTFEELQIKYNSQIDHFQEMQSHVEQKLLQVEKEMNFYQKERSQHLQKINLLKKQLQLKQSRQYFSFGGAKHTQVQTDDEGDQMVSNQCFQISIKTLIQQNQHLKNVLYQLYNHFKGEQIPKELEVELKILSSIKNSNTQASLKIQQSNTSLIKELELFDKNLQKKDQQEKQQPKENYNDEIFDQCQEKSPQVNSLTQSPTFSPIVEPYFQQQKLTQN